MKKGVIYVLKNINSNLCQLKCEDFNKYYSYNREECTAKDVDGIYTDYGHDVKKIKSLKLEEERK